MMAVLALFLRSGLAALLGYAGGSKLRSAAQFAEEIANYRILPGLAPLLASTLPGIELAVALVLMVGSARWRAGAALAAVAILLVFTAAVTSVWLRGIDVRCGCFGTGGGPIDGLTVVRDVAFVVWAAAVLAQAWRATAR